MRVGLAVVRGRSMLPTLRPGDRLLVRYDVTARPGRVVLARLPTGVAAVKRLTASGADSVTLESDNRAEGWAGVLDADAVLAVVLARVWPRPRALR